MAGDGAGAAGREGWLLKRKKGLLGGWQRRFFALGGGALAYGAEEGEVKGGWARGTIPLAGVEGGCAVEGGGQVLVLRARMGEGGDDEKPREFQLKAESAEEAQAWAEALRAALGELSLEGGEQQQQPGDGEGGTEGGQGAPSEREGGTGAEGAGGREAPAAASGLPEGMEPRESVVGEVPAVLEEEPPAPHDEVEEPPAPGAGAPEPDAPPPPQEGGSSLGDELAGGAPSAAAPAAEAEGEKKSDNWGKIRDDVDKGQKLGSAVEALTGTKPKPKRLYGADLVRHLEQQKKEEEARKGPRKKRVPKWKLEEGRWVINDQYVQEIVGGTVGTRMQEDEMRVVEYALEAYRGSSPCRKCGGSIPAGEEAWVSRPDDAFSYHKGCTPSPMPCSECTAPMEGPVVVALGKAFHPDCFACCVCNNVLEGKFFSEGGKAFCEAHAGVDSGEKCEGCGQGITSKYVWGALEKKFHPECFKCYKCEKARSKYYLAPNGRVYCHEDFLAVYGQECVACKKKIEGPMRAISGLDSVKDHKWHPDCFNCHKCGEHLGSELFYHSEELWCRTCLENDVAKKCARCSKPITQKCIKALDQSWHPKCFTCKECGVALEKFAQKDGQPYCRKDYLRLFGTVCAGCGEGIEGKVVSTGVEGASKFHPECFKCSMCSKKISGPFVCGASGQVLCSSECAQQVAPV